MKFSRSYLLGLGSGLILSALIAMVIPAGNIKFSEETAPVRNQEASLQDTQNIEFLNEKPEIEDSEVKEASPPVMEEAENKEEGKNEAEKIERNNESGVHNLETQRVFTVPAGATAEKIADLLVEEKWIPRKEEFLNFVKQKNLASQFQVGSYELTQGMSIEEIINELIPKSKD